MINIEDCIIGEFNSDYFQKLEKWSEEKKWMLDSNNALLQGGIITFQEWLKRDKEIRSTMPPALKTTNQ